ncbi:MAG: YncE family protein [Gluconacetobacter diazotrophicus]|nr:YncE family protein [Gluconacetobacter diazotrophicus]
MPFATAFRPFLAALPVLLVAALFGCAPPVPPDGPDVVVVPGHPFSALPLPDGTVLASLSGGAAGAALLPLRVAGAGLSPGDPLPTEGHPLGLASTRNGRLLALAAGDRTLVFDRARLLSGDPRPVLTRITGQDGAIYAAFSPDDRLLAVSEERAGQVSLLPIPPSGAFPAAPAAIRVGRAPVGLVFSPDGAFLYVASEIDPHGGGGTCPAPDGARSLSPGTVTTIALPPDAPPRVVSAVRVGCSPVRIVLSPDGATALVSLRGEDAVASFRTADLRAGSARPVSRIRPGPSPVGLLLSDDGTRLRIAVSDRFGDASGRVSCAAVSPDGNLRALGSIPSGLFPRELSRLPDGRVLVTRYGDDRLQLLPSGC